MSVVIIIVITVTILTNAYIKVSIIILLPT